MDLLYFNVIRARVGFNSEICIFASNLRFSIYAYNLRPSFPVAISMKKPRQAF